MPALQSTKKLFSPVNSRLRQSQVSQSHLYLCLWIPHFSAWSALQVDPSLRDAPAAVFHKGHILAATPAALAAGVEVGHTIAKAQSCCPSLQLVPQDSRRDALAWEEVQRTIYGLTPCLEAIEPGLLFADATSLDRKQLKVLIQAWGLRAGLAHDRATAHLAAFLSTDRDAHTIAPGAEAEFRKYVPVAVLEGHLKAEVLERLHWFGWSQLSHLRPLTRRQLEEQCGAAGELLWRYAQGPKCPDNLRPVATWMPPPEIVARISFEIPAAEPNEWEPALMAAVQQGQAELGLRRAQTLQVDVETPLGVRCARRVLREPVGGVGEAAARQLFQPAQAALTEALATYPGSCPLIRSLEVRLGGFVITAEQTSLFAGTREEVAQEDRQKQLARSIERACRRFPRALGRYSATRPHSLWHEEIWSFAAADQTAVKHAGRP